jgi:hypothetical protein
VVEGGLYRRGITISKGAPFLGEPGGGFFDGDPEEYLEKALETGISLHRGSAFGKPGGGLVYWEL